MNERREIKEIGKRFSKQRGGDLIKVLEVLVACFLLLVLLVFAAGFYPLSHPALTRKVAATIGRAGVDSCVVGEVKVAYWKGVSLHEVTLVKRADTSTAVTLFISKCVIQINIARLAIGLFRKGALATSRELAAPGTPFEKGRRYIAMIIGEKDFKKAVFSRTRLEVRCKNRADVEVRGISADFAVKGNEERALQGSVSAGSLYVAGVPAGHHLSADFSGDTITVRVSQGKGSLLDGKVRCEGGIDLKRGRLTGFTFSAKNVDISEIYKWSDTTSGYVTGRADCKLTLDSSHCCLDSLHGSGTLQVADFTLSRFQFQKTIAVMFAYPYFNRPRFGNLEAGFAIKPGGVLSSDARATGDTINATASGWIKIKGTISKKITCEFTRAGAKALTPFMLKTLDEERGGGRSIRFRIYGNMKNPKFEIVSQQVLQKAVQNMFEDVRSNLKLWLR
jgi:hypothetical protein